MSLKNKSSDTFNKLGTLFNTEVDPSEKAGILISSFSWNSSKKGYNFWAKLHVDLHNGTCGYEALRIAFESEPELIQFLPIVEEDILWE